ncbi:hypothetical protein BaRGS_00009187 [Batillaria attramentaria]|uniref:G-protein coupled receptors family 1 profile domain-containing protein n=1 Tax=Batillaria attramentaria TaxID=370345 RepID=A0ABD0LJ38_9CAEN
MVSNSTIGVTPSYPALVATFTLYALPLLVGVAGNASIVYIIAYNKSLRTGVNAYIANMAALDLLACVMLVPLRMAFYTMDSNTHFSSEIFCRADVFFRSVTDSGRVILLSAVSFERYQTVARPFQRDKAAAARRAFITLAIVWAAIIVTAALLSVFFHDTIMFEFCSGNGDVMYEMWGNIEIFIVLPLSLTTVCVVLVCYALMFRMLHAQRQKLLQHSLKSKNKVSPAPEPAPPVPPPPPDSTALPPPDSTALPTSSPTALPPPDSPARPPIDTTALFPLDPTASPPPDSTPPAEPFCPDSNIKDASSKADVKHNIVHVSQSPAPNEAPLDCDAAAVAVGDKTHSNHSLPCTSPRSCTSKQLAVTSLSAFRSRQPSIITLLQCDSESNTNQPQTSTAAAELEFSSEKLSEKGTASSADSPDNCRPISPSSDQSADRVLQGFVGVDLQLLTSTTAVTEKVSDTLTLSPRNERPQTATSPRDYVKRRSPSLSDRLTVTLALPLISGFRDRSRSIPEDNTARLTVPVLSRFSEESKGGREGRFEEPLDAFDGVSLTGLSPNTDSSQAVTGKDAALSSNVVNVVEMDGTAHLERLENVENVHGDVCVLNTKNRLQGRRRVEGRVAKRLVVLFLTFLLLWLPFPFAVLYIRINHFTPHGHMPWKEGVEQKVTDILAVLSALTTVTAAVNPVFYGLASSNIRSAIHSKLTSAIRWWRPAQ